MTVTKNCRYEADAKTNTSTAAILAASLRWKLRQIDEDFRRLRTMYVANRRLADLDAELEQFTLS
jgi:hypothetical protein